MSTTARSTLHGTYFQAIVAGKSQFVNFNNVAKQSAQFDSRTTLLELFSTQDCWILIKELGDARVSAVPAEFERTDCKRIRGGITTFLGLPQTFGVYVISVVSDGNDGVLDITEGA